MPGRVCSCASAMASCNPLPGTMTWAGAAPETARHCQAMVFQRPVLLRRSTAANITYVLRLQGIPRRQRRAVMTEMLEQAALLPLSDTTSACPVWWGTAASRPGACLGSQAPGVVPR